MDKDIVEFNIYLILMIDYTYQYFIICIVDRGEMKFLISATKRKNMIVYFTFNISISISYFMLNIHVIYFLIIKILLYL